ncbi:protein PLASTID TRANSCRIPTIONALLY ACTIVE 16, chloroplastic [Salvia divinorum]|uniref:Protein PLASTID TRANSCRIPTIONALLY ACTIVE 16, chloroplastic n=1 Tax=Salvia divinorum TaxID=28513 RepID=A0ABD1GPT0_SALDI
MRDSGVLLYIVFPHAQVLANEEAEEEALRGTEQARKTAEAEKKLEEDVAKLGQEQDLASSLAGEAQKKSGASKTEAEPIVQVATVRGQAKAHSLPSLKAVVKKTSWLPPPSKPKDVPKQKGKSTCAQEGDAQSFWWFVKSRKPSTLLMTRVD